MKSFGLLTALAWVGLPGTTTLAAALDPVSSSTPYDWSGLYIGVHAGYSSVDSEFTDVDGFANRDPGGIILYDGHNYVGGVLLGFNHQNDNMILGAEADIACGDLSASGFVDTAVLDETATTNYDYAGTVRARLGFAHDAFHIYGTGGLAFAGIENQVIDLDTGGVFDPDDSFSDDETRLGWVAGGGAEWIFLESWIGRVEGLYYDFGKETYHVDVGATNSRYNVNNTAWTARLAIIWKF
jgi:outer membrane immunogenic protein